MTDWDDLILVGIVARTHGNKGHVIVNPHTDFVDDRFRVGARFQVRRADGELETVEVTAARMHQGRPVIGLAGVGSIGEAERYQAAELRIRPDEQPPLPRGQYYHHQLVGCEAVEPDGTPITQYRLTDITIVGVVVEGDTQVENVRLDYRQIEQIVQTPHGPVDVCWDRTFNSLC